MKTNCNHKIKKNYPFGKKSKADKYCKKCGKMITNHELSKEKSGKKKNKLKGGKNGRKNTR